MTKKRAKLRTRPQLQFDLVLDRQGDPIFQETVLIIARTNRALGLFILGRLALNNFYY